MITTEYYGPSTHPAENQAVGHFVCRTIWGREGAVHDFCSMAVFDDSGLIAGMLYHNYYPDEGVVELTGAARSKRWITRPVLRALFAMPFDILGCQLLAMRVSSRNHNMLGIGRSFGFDEYIIPRLRGRHEDEHVFTLTDDQWRGHKVNSGIFAN